MRHMLTIYIAMDTAGSVISMINKCLYGRHGLECVYIWEWGETIDLLEGTLSFSSSKWISVQPLLQLYSIQYQCDHALCVVVYMVIVCLYGRDRTHGRLCVYVREWWETIYLLQGTLLVVSWIMITQDEQTGPTYLAQWYSGLDIIWSA